MATHSYDGAVIPRCIEHEHVQANYPCTWLRISDSNDAVAIQLHGPAIREIALALAEHAATLHVKAEGWEGGDARTQADFARRLEITRDVARWLALEDFAGLMGQHAAASTDHDLDKE